MKIAMLGGSFNPVHLGHIKLAEEAVDRLHFDKVLFVPTFISPFKQADFVSDVVASNVDRLSMLNLAILESGRSEFAIEKCEIERGGVSYTFDTLEYLTEKYGTRISFIIGDDLIADFGKWYNAARIPEIADIVVARRNSNSPLDFPYKCAYLDNVVFPAASSNIRSVIASSDSRWTKIVPHLVYEYIKKKRLYGYKPIEEYTKAHVKSARYEHCVRVAEMLEKLCNHYKIDSRYAHLTGIAHDMCKDLPNEDKIALAKKDGFEISEIERENPDLLHGRAAAQMLIEDFGCGSAEFADVLDAVRWHTFGRPNQSVLGMLCFVADKIETGRPQATPEYIERHLAMPLYEMILSVVEENIAYLKKHGKTVSSLSLEMIRELKLRTR